MDESGLEGNDHYLAILWPAPPTELKVIKQWTPQEQAQRDDATNQPRE
jgi:hypothetical protein